MYKIIKNSWALFTGFTIIIISHGFQGNLLGIRSVLENFNYIEDSGCHTKINYTDDDWYNLIKDQLDNGWPVIYRAYAENDGPGHAWNVDGYQEGGYLHCNWGWGGSSNGYFYFNNLFFI